VKFTEFHADHVKAWTHGGATTLANAQLLCITHNLAKGAKN
jgi:5-methylcytosine-specific restriction endonuclease McrA